MKRVIVGTAALMFALAVAGCDSDVPRKTDSVETTVPTTVKAPDYKNCKEVPGAIYKGEPGYKKSLDRDGDGIACNK